MQYSTASRIRYIVSTVQNSIDICFVLHWYYKIQNSKSFIGVTSISNSQNCIGQSLLLELVVLRANNNVAFGGTTAFWTTIVMIIKLKNLSVCPVQYRTVIFIVICYQYSTVFTVLDITGPSKWQNRFYRGALDIWNPSSKTMRHQNFVNT